VFFVCISDHGKVTGVDADPVGLVRAGRGKQSTAEQNSNQDDPECEGVDAIRHEAFEVFRDTGMLPRCGSAELVRADRSSCRFAAVYY